MTVIRIALIAFVVLALSVGLWMGRRSHPLTDSDPAWQKIEALTDAVNNGLITPQDYEAKITELVGGSKPTAVAVRKVSRAGGTWTPADSHRITALSSALADGSITREQFDESVAEFAHERQKRVQGVSMGR
jgi:hypothetical protein